MRAIRTLPHPLQTNRPITTPSATAVAARTDLSVPSAAAVAAEAAAAEVAVLAEEVEAVALAAVAEAETAEASAAEDRGAPINRQANVTPRNLRPPRPIRLQAQRTISTRCPRE